MALLKLEGTFPPELLETEEGQALKKRLDSDADIIRVLESKGFKVNFDDEDSENENFY